MTEITKPEQDYRQIMRAIGWYVSGWQGKVEDFRRAFDADAWIFYTGASGQLNKALLADCFEGWAQTGWVIEPRLLSVTIAGEVATVLMAFGNLSQPAASFVDNLTLVKADARWQITNKTAIHQSHAAPVWHQLDSAL